MAVLLALKERGADGCKERREGEGGEGAAKRIALCVAFTL